jgi:hypothetical protein
MNLSNLNSAEHRSGYGETFGFFAGIYQTSECNENSVESVGYNDPDCKEYIHKDSGLDSPLSSPDLLLLEEYSLGWVG